MKIIIALITFGMTSVAAAAVGPAGCGLGNQLFGGTDSQILASTTNGTSGNQTFGITSGTSNCVDASGMATLETFVESNRIALETEAARGQGETLNSVAQILRCPSAEKVSTILRSEHDQIFDGNASDVTAKIRGVLKQNSVLCFVQG